MIAEESAELVSNYPRDVVPGGHSRIQAEQLIDLYFRYNRILSDMGYSVIALVAVLMILTPIYDALPVYPMGITALAVMWWRAPVGIRAAVITGRINGWSPLRIFLSAITFLSGPTVLLGMVMVMLVQRRITRDLDAYDADFNWELASRYQMLKKVDEWEANRV